MTVLELFEQYLEEDFIESAKYTNENVLNANLAYKQTLHFYSCKYENIKKMLESGKCSSLNFVFTRSTGVFHLNTDIRNASFERCKLDELNISCGFSVIEINDTNIEKLVVNCKKGAVVTHDAKLTDVYLSGKLNQLQIYKSTIETFNASEFETGLFYITDDNEKKTYHNLTEYLNHLNHLYIRDNLEAGNDKRGTASMLDTGLFDFKTK